PLRGVRADSWIFAELPRRAPTDLEHDQLDRPVRGYERAGEGPAHRWIEVTHPDALAAGHGGRDTEGVTRPRRRTERRRRVLDQARGRVVPGAEPGGRGQGQRGAALERDRVRETRRPVRQNGVAECEQGTRALTQERKPRTDRPSGGLGPPM